MKRPPMLLAAVLAASAFSQGGATATTISLTNDAPAKQATDLEPFELRGMRPSDFGKSYRYNQRKSRKLARSTGIHPANRKRA